MVVQPRRRRGASGARPRGSATHTGTPLTALPHLSEGGDPRVLTELLGAVWAARASERAQQRRLGAPAESLATARRGTLRALEDYRDALDCLAWPVPRRIQQEIRLHRALCGIT
jgi:hypothetical protein